VCRLKGETLSIALWERMAFALFPLSSCFFLQKSMNGLFLSRLTIALLLLYTEFDGVM